VRLTDCCLESEIGAYSAVQDLAGLSDELGHSLTHEWQPPSMPITAGKKLVGDNSTCVVGKNNLVACIDAHHKHGFVLQPSGSWTF
jgi:hypothetical protein